MPIKCNKSVSKDYGFAGKLVCNECEGSMKQIYRCQECGQEYTIGEIVKRMDKNSEIIYEESLRKEFCKQSLDKTIRVIEEFPLVDVLPAIEYLRDFYELYTNDDTYASMVTKIHKYLKRHQVGLLATFGHHDREYGCMILPSNQKLLLCELRDYRLINEPRQQGIEAEGDYDYLHPLTEDTYPEMYQKFLDKVANNEEIKVEQKPKEKIVVEATFLDE
jgi:hypothetical protein